MTEVWSFAGQAARTPIPVAPMSVAPVFVVGEYRLVVVPALAPIVETFVGLIEGVVVVVGAFPRFFGFVPGVETS
jgi:hypothetical protein